MKDEHHLKMGNAATLRGIRTTVGYEREAVSVASNSALYRQHAAELVRYATMLVGPNDAADVVANAVISCMSSRSWPQVTNPRAYLYRATHHEARRQLRAGWRRRQAEQRASNATPARFATVEEPDVRRAVQQLSVRQRSAVYLTYWADMTPREISELLDISEGSVKRHLARARTQLREVLNDVR